MAKAIISSKPGMENIYKIIESYPDEYIAIKKQAKKYIHNGSDIDKNERVNILHRPWIAPLNWGLMLYKGADINWINETETSMDKIISRFLQVLSDKDQWLLSI